jgi:hypothetical protein
MSAIVMGTSRVFPNLLHLPPMSGSEELGENFRALFLLGLR